MYCLVLTAQSGVVCFGLWNSLCVSQNAMENQIVVKRLMCPRMSWEKIKRVLEYFFFFVSQNAIGKSSCEKEGFCVWGCVCVCIPSCRGKIRSDYILRDLIIMKFYLSTETLIVFHELLISQSWHSTIAYCWSFGSFNCFVTGPFV